MKKFIIVIVFVFLIAIFISFNYLLWDREKQLASFQDISDSKNLTIETLSEKMNNLDKLNKELNKKVEALTVDNETIKEELSTINFQNMELNKELVTKNDLLGMFKKAIDVVPIETVIKKWVEAVDTKNYKSAQALISSNASDATLKNAEAFKEVYQSELKAIRIKTSQLFTELTDAEHLGKLQFKVVLEVDKPDSTDENKDKIPEVIFKSGDNTKYMTMELNTATNAWMISEIEDKP